MLIRVTVGVHAGTIVSGLVMTTTLTVTGASMESNDSKSGLGSALKDAGGPCIGVLTKLVTVVSIVNVAHSNWVSVGCPHRTSYSVCERQRDRV